MKGTDYSFRKHLRRFKELTPEQRMAIVKDQARQTEEMEAKAHNPKRYMSLEEWNERKYGVKS